MNRGGRKGESERKRERYREREREREIQRERERERERERKGEGEREGENEKRKDSEEPRSCVSSCLLAFVQFAKSLQDFFKVEVKFFKIRFALFFHP